MKRKTISKSKLWQSMLDDYKLRYNFLVKYTDYKTHVSYALMELQYHFIVLGLEILNAIGIIKLED